jgi:tRNA-Thr(GGU) m(6)t(6)A37 methyltransferase TsaA
VRLRPVATVENGIFENVDDWDEIESKLVFREELVAGLENLDHFKHIWVIFGFDRKRGYSLKVHPRHDPTKPLVGVFASRSPRRPNRLGLTLVEFVRMEGRTVVVRGLDAFDGSPVYDVKPYEEEIDY